MSSRVPCPDSLNICAFCPLPLFSLCPLTVICLSGELNQKLLETVTLSCVMFKSPLAHSKQGWQEGDMYLLKLNKLFACRALLITEQCQQKLNITARSCPATVRARSL